MSNVEMKEGKTSSYNFGNKGGLDKLINITLFFRMLILSNGYDNEGQDQDNLMNITCFS